MLFLLKIVLLKGNKNDGHLYSPTLLLFRILYKFKIPVQLILHQSQESPLVFLMLHACLLAKNYLSFSVSENVFISLIITSLKDVFTVYKVWDLQV